MDDVLAAAGTTAQKVGYDNIAANGAIYKGTALLGGGAVLAGLMLGAITAFLVDRKFWWAAGYSAGGAALAFIGLIHGTKVGWNIGGQIALGYLFAAVIFAAVALWARGNPALAPLADDMDEDTETEHPDVRHAEALPVTAAAVTAEPIGET
jgi:AGZA family xanthine/uracil permease-like MFS transporter